MKHYQLMTVAPTQKLIDVLVDLAREGVGLIIAGTAYISREGRWGKNTTGMDNERLIKPLSRHNIVSQVFINVVFVNILSK